MSLIPVTVISDVSRTNLGPYTTDTWTYSCTEVIQNVNKGAANDNGWAAQTCIVDSGKNNRPTDEQDCWPPRQTGVPTTTEAVAGWGVYSPGISCPAGYTSVAASTHGVKSGFKFQFPLDVGETAIGCCPIGAYQPLTDSYGHQTCVQFLPTTTFLVGTCSSNSPVYTPFAIPGKLGNATYSSFKISAPLFQMVYQATDLGPIPSSTSSSSSTPTPTPTSASETAQKNSNRGPSAGAIAGIAIAAVLAVIIAATAGFCLWRRRRRRRLGGEGGKGRDEVAYDGLPQHHHESSSPTPHHVYEPVTVSPAGIPLPPYHHHHSMSQSNNNNGYDDDALMKGVPVQADSRPVPAPAPVEMPVEMQQPAELHGAGGYYR
ncbi:hypothetical protein F5Y17DRAFT_256120 [Xylariaceae sp. FL0594]|nr:hypothetical protein F5Y17DRAFT_256120 [Xylariaceae sp. FL0594]